MLQKEINPYIQLRRIGAALLCLILFLGGQFSVTFQHYLEHSVSHDHLHNQEAESDACHQAIFHVGSTAACEHPAHLTATHTDCELCDYLLQFTEFSLLELKLSLPKTVSQAVFNFLSPDNFSPVLLATARAPPVSSLHISISLV